VFVARSVADRAAQRAISALDPGKQPRTVFAVPEGEIFSFAAAPKAGLLAVRERLWVPKESGQTERALLHIVARDGSILETIEQGRRWSWRASGTDLAVMTGEYQSSNDEPLSTGIWWYTVGTRKLVKISSTGTYVNWAAFDDNIYIWDTAAEGGATVSRYNVRTGASERTSHHSIYFSPTGKYYYKPGGVIAGEADIYLRNNDSSIFRHSRALADVDGFDVEGWAPGVDVVMLDVVRRSDKSTARLLYDPASDSAVEIVREGVVGWGRSGQELIYDDGQSVSLRGFGELRVDRK
jgi:hypothetical protein